MKTLSVHPITSGPRHHFFGYYDKFQVDATHTKMLTMEVDFMDRQPTADDVARIGVIDLAEGNRLEIVAQTQAWCWQQSCMLQWFPAEPDRKIIYNVRLKDRFGCCVQDILTGDKRIYDRPIYTISSDGAFALCPNFSRLATQRPGYGYEGLPDPWAAVNAPKDDGIYRLDLATGESRLIISIQQITECGLSAGAVQSPHWFNHLLIAPGNQRFIFLNRWRPPSGNPWCFTRMFTANVDGTGIHIVNDHEMTSHFIWRDADTILAWARRFGQGDHYYRFRDRTDDITPLGAGVLTRDGHMSYRPQGGWIVTDTYPTPDEPFRRLLLYHEGDGRLIELGRLAVPPSAIPQECRCDLHPRWSRDGNTITFDSLHEGPRQIYSVDVRDVVV